MSFSTRSLTASPCQNPSAGSAGPRLARRHHELLLLGAAQHLDHRLLADALLGEEPVQLVDRADRLAGETHDDVAGKDAGGTRSASRRGRLDADAALARQVMEAHDA